jgi:hypothetical protein
MVAAIEKATGVQFEQDRHGEILLTPGDCDFIRRAAERQDALRSESSSPR